MSKIFLVADGNYSKRIEEALAGQSVFTFNSLKGLESEIVSKKPQLVFIPEKAASGGAAAGLLKSFSFVPFMAYGEFGKTPAKSDRRIKNLLKLGIASCANVQMIIERDKLINEIEAVLWKSLAAEPVWDKERSITLEDRRGELRRNISAAAIVIAAIVVLGFIFREKILPEKKLVPKMYSVPYSGISGIALKGDILWGCDWKSQSIYEHMIKQKLQIRRVFAFPEIRFTGIAVGSGGRLWTLDTWGKTIKAHRFDEKLTVVQEIPSPGEAPDSITFDGKYLLVGDSAENKVYILKPEENYKVIKEFALPGSGAAGVYADGKYLWVLDSDDNKLYKCGFSDFELKVESIFIPPEYENFRATVISGDSDYLWLASEKESRVYRYPKKFLESL